MIPNLNLFGKIISPYMIMTLAGIFLALFYTQRTAKKKNLNEFDMLYMMLFGALGAVIGGHILYAITNIDLIIEFFSNLQKLKSFSQLMNWIIVIFGGGVFYGGLLGGISAGFIYIKKAGLNAADYSDVAAVAIPMFHCIGRIGCFLSGCCYGIECKIGFIYKYSLAPGANGVRRLPIQLIEAGFNLLLCLTLMYFLNKNRFKGYLLKIYLIVYAIGRFILEFFRGDKYRGYLFGLSTSQIISIIIFITVILITVSEQNKFKQKNKKGCD